MIIASGTVTGDMPMPATAVYLQQKLGAPHCPHSTCRPRAPASCSGLSIADQFVRSSAMNNVLVVGVELLSRVLNWKDRTTCVLFGDGAGAAVIGPAIGLLADNGKPRGILSTRLHTDGSLAKTSLMIPGGGSVAPLTHEHLLETQQEQGRHARPGHLQGGREETSTRRARTRSDVAGMTPDEVDWIWSPPGQHPHHRPGRAAHLHVRRGRRSLVNIDRVGNTSSASIPILLDENLRSGKIQPGHTVLMCAPRGRHLPGGARWSGCERPRLREDNPR